MISFKTKTEFITSPLTLHSGLISLRPAYACSSMPHMSTIAGAAELWRPYHAGRSDSTAPWPRAPRRARLSLGPLFDCGAGLAVVRIPWPAQLPRLCRRSSGRPGSPYHCPSLRPTSPYLRLASLTASLLPGSPI